MGSKRKEHIKRIRESKFNRQRPPHSATNEYRGKCRTGYRFTSARADAAGQAQFHHILPVECIQDSNIKPYNEIKFFRDCMAATEWDINDGGNLIALPTKKPYAIADGTPMSQFVLDLLRTPQLSSMPIIGALKGEFGALPDLPCHLNEHPSYNTHVIEYTNREVWGRLAGKNKKEQCETITKGIADELDGVIFQYGQFLDARGRGAHSNGYGAAYCWTNRKKVEEFWYIPFSMNPDNPKKVKPPPNYDERKEASKKWLKTMFAVIK